MIDRSDEPRQLEACVRLADHFLTRNPILARRNLVTILRGYAELYASYEPGEFPWWRVNEILNALGSEARFPKLPPPRPWIARPKRQPTSGGYLERHGGRWVSRRWLAINGRVPPASSSDGSEHRAPDRPSDSRVSAAGENRGCARVS